MADAPESEVIQAQELNRDVPPNRLPRVRHGVSKLHQVLVDAQCHVAFCGVPKREVSILVGQHSAKWILIESRKQSEPHDEGTLAPPLAAVTVASAFVDCHLGAGNNANSIKGSSFELFGDLPG